MASIPSPLQKPLSISPAAADLSPNAVCRFAVEPAGIEVQWNITPQIGKIDANGIYLAPEKIAIPQSVIVTATAKSGESAIATIDLSDGPGTILWLGWYAVVVAVLLGIGILIAWNVLYRPPASKVVIINPPLVTLDPAKDESFTFVAMVSGDSKNEVKWSVEGGGEIDSAGIFREKLNPLLTIDKDLIITARSVADPKQSGTAIVHLISGSHLEIVPLVSTVFSSQQVPFRTPNSTSQWSVSPHDIASISPDGMLTSGRTGRTEIVQVTAQGAKARERASVAVVINPLAGSTDYPGWLLMAFVIMCGSLGSMVYYASSFVGYVGNRTFRSSWFWFYISRPFVGGALALIFFFIVGSGLVNGTSVFDLMKIGMVAALVGLFSDKAVKKLSDILDVLLMTKDDRKDKVTDTKPQTAATERSSGSVVSQPRILSANPASIKQAIPVTVEFTGSNFRSALKVKVNGRDTTSIGQTDTSFKVDIPAEEAKPPHVEIAVASDQGSALFELPVQ